MRCVAIASAPYLTHNVIAQGFQYAWRINIPALTESRMRALQISGVVLIAIGLWIIIRPPSYSREESVLKFGDIEAKMQEQHTVPG